MIAMKIHSLSVKGFKNRRPMHYSGCSAKSYLHSSQRVNRACPTNGSDCGSLRDHNLTLFVM